MMHSRCARPGPDDARDRPSHSSRDLFALVGGFVTGYVAALVGPGYGVAFHRSSRRQPLSAFAWAVPFGSRWVSSGHVQMRGAEFRPAISDHILPGMHEVCGSGNWAEPGDAAGVGMYWWCHTDRWLTEWRAARWRKMGR